jgi:uncharacterized protein (TIGR04255 family)
MGRKLKNAPVYFTVAQVRYNPILSLDSYIPKIQESMRKAGFPDFKKGVRTSFNVTAIARGDNVQPQLPTIESVAHYVFSNADSTSGFVVEQNAVAFQATKYDTFETFSEELLKGLDIIHKSVVLDFSERVGVRYLDAVIPRDGDKLSDYLVPEVLGIASRLTNIEVLHSFSETLVRVPPIGTVTARTIIQNGQLGFPPDLLPTGLKMMASFMEFNGIHAIIDTDGSFEGREAFDLGRLKERLVTLHDEISKSFKATVTDHARSVWD